MCNVFKLSTNIKLEIQIYYNINMPFKRLRKIFIFKEGSCIQIYFAFVIEKPGDYKYILKRSSGVRQFTLVIVSV